MPYAEDIRNCKNIDDIIDYCHNALPMEYKKRPWTHPELNHGINLLESEVALNCYMSAYGDMHASKCRAAMMNFPFNNIRGNIEIVDWGCGQGIGSATIIEILKQRNMLRWLRRITLIEPSGKAIERAYDNIRTLTRDTVTIDVKDLFLPADNITEGKTLDSIGYIYNNVIHVFSNILDVTAIDLGAIAKMVASAHGKHFVLCIGPQNGAKYRIEKFCSVFGEQNYFSQINSACYAHAKRTAHPYSCMTRCFEYNGATIDLNRLALVPENQEPIYHEYDLRLQVQNQVLSLQKARLAWRLENILSVDDIMYIDATVNEVVIDFIIVRPNNGILLLNVFDRNITEFELEKKTITTDEQSYQSPIDLINLCQSSIKDAIEELLMNTIENSCNFSLIKKAIVFTENSIDEIEKFFNLKSNVYNFTHLFGREIIENRDVSQNLYTTVGFKYNNTFDDVIKRKLAAIISPSWHSYQEGRIDMQPIGPQKRLSESSITQQKISGVAGSGKTQVLAFRAVNAMKRTGGNVLILTYNITLANYLKLRLSEIREDFSWEKIDIYPYHQFFRIRAAECQLHVNFNSYQDEKFFDNAKNYKKYSAIFIDEVQDYTSEWLHIIKQNFLLEPDGELVVFGDPKQNLYQRATDPNGDIRLGIIGGQWNRQLTTSRRFATPRLANLATAFQAQFMTELPVDNITVETPGNTVSDTFNFQVITYIDLRQNNSFESITNNIINIIFNDNNEAKDFVILASSTQLLRNIDSLYRQKTNEKTEITFISNKTLEWLKKIHQVEDEKIANWKFNRDFEAIQRARKQLFTTDKHCLKISTIQSFKGWESPSVIVILENDSANNSTKSCQISPQTIYTAITRARENIYIINAGNNTYHKFFYNQSL